MELNLPVINPHGQGLDVSHVEIAELFPEVDAEFEPFGHRVIVQVRRVVEKTASGIYLPPSAQEAESYNGQVGKLIAVGGLAFRNRTTGAAWPEGIWAKVGQYVKVPRWGGDRWTIHPADGLGPVSIAILGDMDIIGLYTGDVRKVRAHLA